MKILAGIFTLAVSVTALADFRPSLIGGSEVRPGEYPEVIRIRSGRSACSAAIVGPKVILTAGHCTQDNGEIVPINENVLYEFVLKQQVYKARCKLAPDYRREVGDQDMAYCKIDREVDVKYAIISKEGPKLREVVTLIGYGCVREGGGGGNDGKLRVGEAPVVRESDSEYYSYHTKGSTALCFGDSGGPSFKRVSDPKGSYHYVYGVNSRGNIKDLSLLTAVYHPNSIAFAEAFERSQGVEICGISLDCDGNPEEPRRCQDELQEVKRALDHLDQCMSRK